MSPRGIVPPRGNPPCIRCGAPGAELHHWAPVAIFGAVEAECWPRSWLCRDCHRFWHDAIARRRWEDGVEIPDLDDRHGTALHAADALEDYLVALLDSYDQEG